MLNILSRYKYFFLLIPVACIGYWQVAFFQNTLKWDAIDQYYPWRMFVVECLRYGSLPLWNPYEQLGYPIHADPQSGAWYPMVWLFALFGHYSLYSLQTEFMLHIIFGGVGLLLLLESFEIKRPFSFLLACAYMLSGFFIGNAQHITYIVASCWLPFVFYSYKKMTKELQFKYAVWFSLFCFLLVSGGYPAFSIISFYTLFGWFVFVLIKKIRTKDNATIKKLIALNFASVVFTFLLSSVVITSVFSNGEYLLRASGLSYDIASHGPFSPQALMSLLLPLAAVKNPMMMDSDISMSTIYLGLFMLIALLFSLFSKKNNIEKIIWAVCLLFLLAAFGSYTPVRKWMYDSLPLMDLFRFPSVFRIFVMIGFLLLAGFALNKISDLKKLTQPTGILFFISVAVAAYVFLSGKGTFAFENIGSLSFYNSILIQACLQAIFLGVLYFVFKSEVAGKRKINLLLTISLLDLICAAQLNVPVNVVYANRTKQVARAIKKKYKHEFTIPELRPLKLNNDSTSRISPLWRNNNIFAKQPAWDGYNSFLLNNYLHFVDDSPLRNKIIENNWAYFSDNVIFYRDSISIEQINYSGNNSVFVSETYRNKFALENDTTEFVNSIQTKIFEPHHIKFETTANHKALFTLMQQYFPGWEIFVDGKKADEVISNYLFMSVVVEKGNHEVEYVYKNQKVKIAFFVSAVALISCLVILLYFFLIQNGRNSLPK